MPWFWLPLLQFEVCKIIECCWVENKGQMDKKDFKNSFEAINNWTLKAPRCEVFIRLHELKYNIN